MDGGEEGFSEFVVARGDPAKLLELIEEALDAVAPAVTLGVEGQRAGAGRQWRNHGVDSIERQALTDAISIIAAVEHRRFQDIVLRQAFVEHFKLPAIVSLARRQVERYGAIFVERRGVDFGGEPAARASQSLIASVFFGAPAACGCARTVVESINTSRAAPNASPCKSSHSRRHTPRASQRRKRM